MINISSAYDTNDTNDTKTCSLTFCGLQHSAVKRKHSWAQIILIYYYQCTELWFLSFHNDLPHQKLCHLNFVISTLGDQLK